MRVEQAGPAGEGVIGIDVDEELAAAAERSGLFQHEPGNAVAQLIAERMRADAFLEQIETALRNLAEPMTPARKREIGLNPRMKMNEPLAAVLTERGIADPRAAVRAMAHAPVAALSRALQLALIAHDDSSARFCIDARSSPCEAALALDGAVFPAGKKLPAVPLASCDTALCTCRFNRHHVPDIAEALAEQRAEFREREALRIATERIRYRQPKGRPPPEEFGPVGTAVMVLGMIALFAFVMWLEHG